MQEEELGPFDLDQDRLAPADGESEASTFKPRDNEPQPFIERPIPRGARRNRWILIQPPDDAGESETRA